MMDRRTFLLAPFALAAAKRAGPARLETFRDWLRASPSARADALQPLVERIRLADAQVHAWVQVAPQKATASGALSGIPFGAKDIIETRGLSTAYGSPIYEGRIGTSDAAIVRLLRQKGGILLGKTHTAAFAYRDPPPTRNPRDLAHTPGGSSSGSAAAVAAGMVPIAIGTQTGGSTLRPASFCGITGFKATYGLLSTEGVLEYSKSLDTLGFFTHTAADMLAFWNAIGQTTGHAEDVTIGAPDSVSGVEPAMASAFRDTVAKLRSAGVTIRVVDIAAPLDALRAAQRTISDYEGAHVHEERYKQYGARMGAMGELVRTGLQIPAAQYDAAIARVAEQREQFAALYRTTPIIILPAATGPAPLGLDNTGDSRMNAPFTTLGTPAISIPMPVASGLPLGLQLTANRGDDARVIRAAVRLERILA